MIIYAVYIVMKSGNIILSEYFLNQEDLPNSALLGGLMGAIQMMSKETLGTQLKSIEVEGLAYHVRSFGLYSIWVITELEKQPGDLIQEMGLRFMKTYGEVVLEPSPRLDKFNPFRETIRDILGTRYDIDSQIRPKKTLNTKAIFELPVDLQPVALAIISIGEGTVSEIDKEANLGVQELGLRLEELQKLGYLGRRTKDNSETYFCTTF